ncbi:MAG: quinone oxidoreductase [Acidobacteria bacterium]|nr:quinone oxidoreductase [Acidobacteriota bacterium]
MKAICFHQHGDARVLQLEELPAPSLRDGEVLVRTQAIGVNFIDIYFRRGVYPAKLPMVPGNEASGTVAEVGNAVTDFHQGDRVVFVMTSGSYAENVVVPASRLVRVPDAIDSKVAAAAMLQGLTAHYLTHGCFWVQKGNTVLVHAGAGGVGLLLIQICRMLKAKVITTVSSEEKARVAREAGADEVIVYTHEDFQQKVQQLTAGAGVDVVYDSVGKSTFEDSLKSLKTRGYLVLFGQSSGAVPPFDPQILNTRGSLFLTRPSLGHYTATRRELTERAEDLFRWIRDGSLKIQIYKEYPLRDARLAHEALESRQTVGKILLIP